jgi:hypothetical protein
VEVLVGRAGVELARQARLVAVTDVVVLGVEQVEDVQALT